jgi:HTH-type transcriptional regulator/antitoxin MqsA
MCHCHVCGKTETRQELVSDVFDIDGKLVRVEAIPVAVCTNCEDHRS